MSQGYDFAFLRRSRIFDECSSQTGYKWNTQYVGGNKLAVCNGKASKMNYIYIYAATLYVVFSCEVELFPLSIFRSICSDFRSKYGIFSKRSGLFDHQGQRRAVGWRPKSFWPRAEGAGHKGRGAAPMPCMWTLMIWKQVSGIYDDRWKSKFSRNTFFSILYKQCSEVMNLNALSLNYFQSSGFVLPCFFFFSIWQSSFICNVCSFNNFKANHYFMSLIFL